MAALDPAVAAVRTAVRRALRDLRSSGAPQPPPAVTAPPAGFPPLLLVACSGGADSLALAAAAGFVAPRVGWRAGLLTVDHRLQPGSGERATAVAGWARSAGLSPVEVLPVTVAGRPGGPEAAARSARYQALTAAAGRLGGVAVLLGHTRDDQAETVLLALARGAGPRGLSGMPARRDAAGVAWLRPLLEISREQTVAACRALGLTPWQDPHNTDPAYARARVRASALPALAAALGPGVVGNLARTAHQLAADNAALDGWADAALAHAAAAVAEPDPGGVGTPSRLGGPGTGGVGTPSRPGGPGIGWAGPPAGPASDGTWPVPVDQADRLAVPVLRELPAAVRTRVLHRWARRLGCPGAALSHRHVAALDALVTAWRGQGPSHLPGGITVARTGDRLVASVPNPSRRASPILE